SQRRLLPGISLHDRRRAISDHVYILENTLLARIQRQLTDEHAALFDMIGYWGDTLNGNSPAVDGLKDNAPLRGVHRKAIIRLGGISHIPRSVPGAFL